MSVRFKQEIICKLEEETCTFIYERGATQDSAETQEENKALLKEINQLCKRQDRRKPEVIFLLGGAGVGKSAMVNTLGKVIRGKYYPKAKTGSGNAKSKTLTLQWYAHCGVEDFELQPGVLVNFSVLPNVLDAPGNDNPNANELREILEMVFEGCIPVGTSFDYLRAALKRVKASGSELSFTSSEELKVTKVVFVVSCTKDFPMQMVECLNEVLNSYDDKTGRQKYNIDVLVVITKYDLVDGQERFRTDRRQEQITKEEYLEFKNKVAKNFSIEGAMQDNCIEWVSYVDGYSEDNPFIDNIALKFLRQIMRPDRSKHKMENDPSSIAVPSRHEVEQRQMSGKELTEDNHLYKQYILIGLVFACALIAGTYKLVSKPASK